MKYASKTHIGRRQRNEDHSYVPEPGDLGLVMVADGMGGHNAGMRASTLAIQCIQDRMKQNSLFHMDMRVRNAVAYANSVIYRSAQTDEGCRGMGTTITLAVLEKNRYTAANMGDSRLYHFNAADGSLRQVTKDHSYVALLVANGEITEEQAAIHPQRNIITRALGTREKERLDLFHEHWNREDILLLCTDGLTGGLPPETIRKILAEHQSLAEKAEKLIQQALEADGSDNVTVVLALNDEGVDA